jgi:LGFP repeat-containing protein
VLSANPYTYNLCFAGSFVEWSQDEWLSHADDIRIAVHVTLEVARRKGFAGEIIADPYRRADGIADHQYVTRILGIGTHTDVGPNFPWWFAKQVLGEELGGGGVTPVVNEIDQKAEEIAASTNWLGARLTPGETLCPDNVGRFAKWEGGYIYWTPTTGPKAIPNHLFEAFAGYGFEAGFLGYPVTDHSVLVGPDGQPWGDVQGYQRATLYRKYGQPGYFVHGYIGAYWFRSGFENGPFGWPVSLEEPLGEGRVQHFEHGDIVWSPDGTIGLKPQDGPDTVIVTKH